MTYVRSSSPLLEAPASRPAPRMSAGIAPSRSVRIAELSPDKKARLWKWIKANDPAISDFITCDDTRRILDAFAGSSVVLDIDYVQEALQC